MNERIKKLISECTYTVTDYSMGIDNSVEEFDKEKFAELIVAECILTIQMGITRDGPNTEKYLRSIKHITQIKEHFGVKE